MYLGPPLLKLLVLLPECLASAVADVVFLVDGSWSVGRPNFQHIRSFISAAVDAFQINADRTRVAVVQYSNDARTEFNLNQHTTRSALLKAVSSLSLKGGNTKTGKELFYSFITNFNHLFYWCYCVVDLFSWQKDLKVLTKHKIRIWSIFLMNKVCF